MNLQLIRSSLVAGSRNCTVTFEWVGVLLFPVLRSITVSILVLLSGCNLVPDIKHKPQHHNPFPQISKVAVLPFRNQSQEPTLSGARVSMAYYNELQSIRGFEVIPFGVVENQLAYFETQVLRHPILAPDDFQQFAKYLGVDAVLQGAITDYDAYYPPRMTMKVNWYAANAGFHPIPVGYGLPWGTKQEKKIPEWIRLESERSLAAEQMKTQTPVQSEHGKDGEEEELQKGSNSETLPKPTSVQGEPDVSESTGRKEKRIASARIELPNYAIDSETDSVGSKVITTNAIQEPAKMPEAVIGLEVREPVAIANEGTEYEETPQGANSAGMPADWPDPQGFIPRQPSAKPPELRPQYEPIISHMRAYNGNDEDFTHALGEYFYFRDDARFGGWQSYLQRSEDFIRFCCYQHIVETLESRGGSLKSRMILRWPINRYER